jgi:hypothetical protein
MEKKAKKSLLTGVPAWALSLMTFFATLIPLFIIHDYEIPGPPPNTIQIITDFTTYCILVPMACFFICRTFPKSVWYTPVICNTVGFLMFYSFIIQPIFDPDDWITLSDMIIFGSNCILSITGAVVGARIGLHKMAQTE